ncbi:MAG: hypothetical protein KGS48_03325 [Bacteroidetes bacterium]|nr:hypothetical protein [Bacteroidota bacterium]
MYVYSNINGRRGGLGCLVFGVLFILAGYYILRGLFYLLYWAAPFLLVLALLVNWRAVADTGKDFLRLLERNPVAGLFMGFLAVIGFPFFSLFLLVKALGYNKLAAMKQEGGFQSAPEDEFTAFEELESTPKSQPDTPMEPVQLPEKKQPEPPPVNPYDTFFGE